jgi:hypothetical protein
MAPILKHKRGRLEGLTAITASLQKGELVFASGSSNITSSNGSSITFIATEEGRLQAVNRVIKGTTIPNVFSSSAYGGLVDGVPYYASSSAIVPTLYLLGGNGNQAIDLTGNINAFSSSVSQQLQSLEASNTIIEKVFYVSEQGSDSNDGKTLGTTFRTVKQATIAAAAQLASKPAFPIYKQNIRIKAGYYVEEAPITVPSGVSIMGDDLRSVVIKPTDATKGENLFLMNNGTYCWGLRLEGCVIDNLEDPRKGFFFAFAPNAYITTSPYVQNCSCINTPFEKFYTPLDYTTGNPLVGNGPGGLIIDDSVLHPYSPLNSMIVDSYTQVAFNGIGVCARGRGYGQLVSFFTNFSRVGTYCIDGGHCSLLNSNTTFGDYGLRAKGLRMLVKPDISAVSASIDSSGSLLITSKKSNIQNYMINQLSLSGSYNYTYVSGSGLRYASTITDSGLLIDAISADLLVPTAARTSQFVSGLFKGQDVSTGSIFTLPIASGSSFTKGAITVIPQISNTSGSLTGDFVLAWQKMKQYIINDPEMNFSTLSVNAKNKVGQLFDVLINTITQVVISGSGKESLVEFGSLVTSTSHDFSYAGSGVNFLALPVNQGGVGVTNLDIRVYQENGGRVYYTAGDETGDYYAGSDFIIRQQTGTIDGRTFTKALAARFTPLNLALET